MEDSINLLLPEVIYIKMEKEQFLQAIIMILIF